MTHLNYTVKTLPQFSRSRQKTSLLFHLLELYAGKLAPTVPEGRVSPQGGILTRQYGRLHMQPEKIRVQ